MNRKATDTIAGNGNEVFDAIVVGLGAMGSCALEALARRGHRALGIDRFDPPHTSGSSHGGSRVIRHSYFEHPDYVPLLHHAYEGFDRLARASGERLRHETGLVVGGACGNAVTAGMLRSAHEHGLVVEAIDGGELMRRAPQFSVPRDWEIVMEKRGGFVRPEATIRAALRHAAAHGARIERNMPVLRWSSDGERVVVETHAHRFDAACLILSGGAWMGPLLGLPMLRLAPQRETIVWFDDAGDPLLHERGMPVWLFDRGAQPAVYGVPAFDGMGAPPGVKFALHGRGPQVRPEQISEPIEPALVAEAVEAAVERIPSLRGRRITGAAHCLYTMSADGDFVLGHHERYRNVALACGFSGHGFKFAPVIGEALADLAVNRGTDLPIGFLGPDRFHA